MQWSDVGIILSARKQGESSAIIRAFTHEQGIYAGVVKGAQGKGNRGVLQTGNIVNATWQARLSEHIGVFRLELLEPVAALAMDNAQALAALSSACALLETALPERHPYRRLWETLLHFLHAVKHGHEPLQAYVQLELSLLAESGFGLDLSQCAATGARDDLLYVSPKSGRAVSRTAGAPYQDRLLPLPAFLLPSHSHRRSNQPDQDIRDGLRLTGYFLEHWLLTPHGRRLPGARGRLVEMVG